MTTQTATKTINLTRGVPAIEAFPTQDLIECSSDALKKHGNKLLQYGRSPGFAPLTEWLANRYNVSSDEVFMGNSSLEILSFVTQITLKPGDRVFVESPTYDRTNTLLKRAGAEIVPIPMENDGMILDNLEEELNKKPPVLLYIVADFQNPMGITTSAAKRKQLAEWAEKYNFMIIEDAPYRPLRYKGKDEPTIRSFNPEKVLHMSSFSKLLAPGIRLGYMIGPKDFVSKLIPWAVDSYIGPVLPTQGMVFEYCSKGLLDKNINNLKNLYHPRLEALLTSLEKNISNAEWTAPEGGFFVGITLAEGSSMDTLLPKADEVGLKLTDGRGFYLNPADGNRFLRIPFCSITPEEINIAVNRLAPLLD